MRESLCIQIDGDNCAASSGGGREYPCRIEYGDFGENFAILININIELFISFVTRRGGCQGSGETRRRGEELQRQDNPLL